MNWYYVDNAGKQQGPLDDAGLEALAAAGGITPATFVWREGMAAWQPLREARAGAAGGAPGSGGTEAVCAECGGVFPIENTINVGNARVCANCKPVFVQKMREGLNLEPAGTLRYAGFWIRFGAVFLDGILLFIVNSLVNFAFGLGFVGHGSRVVPGQGFPLLFIAAFVLELFIGLAYETIMIGKYGATLGKMACRIQVVTADGSPVSYPRALGRYFSKIVSSLICMIGYIMAGFDEERRALHDRMCNTRVVFK